MIYFESQSNTFLFYPNEAKKILCVFLRIPIEEALLPFRKLDDGFSIKNES